MEFGVLDDLIGELCSPLMLYKNGMVIVESKKAMKDRGIDSPNMADSFIMAFVETEELETAGGFDW